MTKIVLSNTLADLAERVKKSVAAQERAEATAIDEALAAGAMLLEARAQTTHGAWTSFIDRAGVHERQARRLMQLARSGLKPDTVSDLGGVKAALLWLKGLTLPTAGQALIATVGRYDADAPFGLVVPAIDGHGFNMAFVHGTGPVDSYKRQFVGPEPMLWVFFFALMTDVVSLGDLKFEIADDTDGGWGDLVRATGPFAEVAA